MNDHQLKIRIQIQQQPPRSIEQQHPELTEIAHDITEQPPLDWQKVSIAAILLCSMLFFIGYILFSGDDDDQSTVETVSDRTPHAPAIPALEENIPLPLSQPLASITVDEVIKNTAVHDKPPMPKNKPVLKAEKSAQAVAGTVVTPDTTTVSNPIITPPPVPKKKGNLTTTPAIPSNPSDHPQVIRAQLSGTMFGREPADSTNTFYLNQDINIRIYFFAHLRDFQGQQVHIFWYHQDKLDSKINLQIGNDNWRTFATKVVDKKQLGKWRVELIDDAGNLLAERAFTVN
ncbi:MAG: DUF2914 domain-containing protein [Pseudomonadota bacterium]